MSIFQILAACFGLFMLYVTSIHRRKAALLPLEIGLWYSIWLLFIIIAIFPQLLQGLAGVLHFARVFDLLIVAAFMILTLVVIISYFQQKVTHQKIDTLVRKIALSDKVSDGKAAKKKTKAR